MEQEEEIQREKELKERKKEEERIRFEEEKAREQKRIEEAKKLLHHDPNRAKTSWADISEDEDDGFEPGENKQDEEVEPKEDENQRSDEDVDEEEEEEKVSVAAAEETRGPSGGPPMPPPKRRKEPPVKPVAKEPEDLDALLAEFGVEVKEKSDTKKKKKEKKEPAADPGAGLNGSVAAATEEDRALEEKIDKLFAKDGKLEEQSPSGSNGTPEEPAEEEDTPTAPSMDPEAIRKRLLAKGAGKGSTTAASARKSAAANLALSEAKERQKNMKSKKDEKKTTMGYKVRGG